jgi:NAD(P)-dependent dehydrogenase (short-subunit alcohol dehydrogenase family)
MKKFKDKVAVITGGNSGIGYSTAKILAENGARVVITGRRKDAVKSAAMELHATGLVADQSNLNDIDLLVSDVARQFGKVDILLINAGISQFATIETATESLFDGIMNVNLKGAYFTLSKFIPILNDHASVVLLSSTSATVSKPHTSIYSASKAALNAVMKIAAVELAPRKIRINAVSPGPVATAIMEKSGIGDQQTQDFILSGIPMSRLGDPGEVAELISYLAGDEASFITGAEFIIDGGQSLNK